MHGSAHGIAQAAFAEEVTGLVEVRRDDPSKSFGLIEWALAMTIDTVIPPEITKRMMLEISASTLVVTTLRRVWEALCLRIRCVTQALVKSGHTRIIIYLLRIRIARIDVSVGK